MRNPNGEERERTNHPPRRAGCELIRMKISERKVSKPFRIFRVFRGRIVLGFSEDDAGIAEGARFIWRRTALFAHFVYQLLPNLCNP